MLIPGGVDSHNLDGKFTSAATKLLTVKSAKKEVMYLAQQTAVKKAIVKGVSWYVASTIGASGISYSLDYLGVY